MEEKAVLREVNNMDNMEVDEEEYEETEETEETEEFSDEENVEEPEFPLSLSPPGEDGKVDLNLSDVECALEELFEYFEEAEGFCQATGIDKEIKYGEWEELGILDEIPDDMQVTRIPGLDAFGQPIAKNAKTNYECDCPKCKRTLAAARFAQHLEKCMGMGRNSSRIASRRLAASASSCNANNAADTKGGQSGSTSGQLNGDLGIGSDEEHFTEDDDEDWTMEKKKKKKGDKGTPKRKGPVSRVKHLDAAKRKAGSPSVSVAASPASSDHLGTTEDDYSSGVYSHT